MQTLTTGYRSQVMGIVLFVAACTLVAQAAGDAGELKAVHPYEPNPRYWQYGGEPVLLLGGTRQDNLFQIPDLEEHLDLLASVGGNYIRNTMSSRDEGNVWPFGRDGQRYDLETWNAEYWQRFENMLRLTHERGIVVQIELWDFWDFFRTWETGPWNPANNVNYTTDDTQLSEQAYPPPQYRQGETFGQPHSFFMTVPDVHNDALVLKYQQKFIDEVLQHTLAYDHVLYCVTNEIHQPQPIEWSVYWANYVRQKAAAAGRRVYVTEMFWVFDFSHEQHGPALEDPQTFDYFEASQNSAVNEAEPNWANLQYAYGRLAEQPRPINHTKMYGADEGPEWSGTTEDVIQQFWRNIVGGAASSRFHRPPAGIGLSEIAQRQIRSARALQERLDVFRCVPDSEHDMLSDRRENEAYLGYEAGRQYAVYFPRGGSVRLDLGQASGSFRLSWLEIDTTRWHDGEAVEGGRRVTLEPPGEGHWMAVLLENG